MSDPVGMEVAIENVTLVYEGDHTQPVRDLVSSGNIIVSNNDGSDEYEPEIESVSIEGVGVVSPSCVTLIYVDEEGGKHEQPVDDITSSGTLVEPESGEDLEISYVVVSQ